MHAGRRGVKDCDMVRVTANNNDGLLINGELAETA
jgi:hypothetical protein